MPTLKKSASSASSSLIRAADGVSIIIPTGTSLNSIPSALSSALTPPAMARESSSSFFVVIIGSIIYIFPFKDARYMALSWVLKISRRLRHSLMALSPRAGFSSSPKSIPGAFLSAPMSSVLIITGFPPILAAMEE